MRSRTRFLAMLALAAATAAPIAQAERPDDRAGARGPGASSLTAGTATVTRPDDRAGLRGPGASSLTAAEAGVTRPDDRAGWRGPGRPNSTFTSLNPDDHSRTPGGLTTIAAQPRSTGIDWNDALLGGLVGIGTALLLTGLFLVVASRRGTPRTFA